MNLINNTQREKIIYLASLAYNVQGSACSVVSSLICGFPDAQSEETKYVLKNVTNRFFDQVESFGDKIMMDFTNTICGLSREIIQIDDKLVYRVGKYLNEWGIVKKNRRKRIKTKLIKFHNQFRENGSLPKWENYLKYETMVNEAVQHYLSLSVEIKKFIGDIENRLEIELPKSFEEKDNKLVDLKIAVQDLTAVRINYDTNIYYEESLTGNQLVRDLILQAEETNDFEQAISFLDRALSETQNNKLLESLYLTYGMVYDNKNNLNKALEFYSKVLEINSNRALVYLWRGEIHQKLDDKNSAIEDIELALAIKGEYGLDEFDLEKAEKILKKLRKKIS